MIDELEDAIHFARCAMARALDELEDAGRGFTPAADALRAQLARLRPLDPFAAEAEVEPSPALAAWG